MFNIQSFKDFVNLNESVNDPVLVALRAAKEDRKKMMMDKKERMKKRIYGAKREQMEDRLDDIFNELELNIRLGLTVKFGGATGKMNALKFALPDTNWDEWCDHFITLFDLKNDDENKDYQELYDRLSDMLFETEFESVKENYNDWIKEHCPKKDF